MILRVPDYYETFRCIAGECKDSCCIGWEIDIDEDTYGFYDRQQGAFGERLRTHMYQSSDGIYSFRLGKGGRCPFLNEKNLCDICMELGEEALSEVCTEYPRFAIEYGEVLQKCLSLSCEEVGRILFSRESPVQMVEIGSRAADEENLFFESIQAYALSLLQNRSKSLPVRVEEFLSFMEEAQHVVNRAKEEPNAEKCIYNFENRVLNNRKKKVDDSSNTFRDRFSVFTEMETLDNEWEEVKEELLEAFTGTDVTEDSYSCMRSGYVNSPFYKEDDYEQLLVYFFFRYFMNSVYDFDVLSYAKLAVVFTLVIRDMDIVRFYKNDMKYEPADRIDVVRIFSKEVEHSQENVEMAKEACIFEDVYKTENLICQF